MSMLFFFVRGFSWSALNVGQTRRRVVVEPQAVPLHHHVPCAHLWTTTFLRIELIHRAPRLSMNAHAVRARRFASAIAALIAVKVDDERLRRGAIEQRLERKDARVEIVIGPRRESAREILAHCRRNSGIGGIGLRAECLPENELSILRIVVKVRPLGNRFAFVERALRHVEQIDVDNLKTARQ